ncbi:MAG: 2-hydroxychromene-2-carboxylate isomerase [Roseibium sp.]|uniref:2-hydroxychromene-2-carboxylate isomerase n=1 Tax=Roseibium sp. TaxID=1936156 RepID=UPI003D9C5B65
METITYFYAPISGYAYLGEKRLMGIAAEAGAKVDFQPVDIQKVFAAAGATPPPKQSQTRLNYRFMDLRRSAERLGLPINPKPKHWPVPAELPARLVHAAQALAMEPHIVSFAMLEAVYARELNLSDHDVVEELVHSLPLDGGALWTEATGDEAAKRYVSATEAAIAQGVPGSPTYVLEGEMFFGQDRLDMLAWRLGVTDPPVSAVSA